MIEKFFVFNPTLRISFKTSGQEITTSVCYLVSFGNDYKEKVNFSFNNKNFKKKSPIHLNHKIQNKLKIKNSQKSPNYQKSPNSPKITKTTKNHQIHKNSQTSQKITEITKFTKLSKITKNH